MIIIFQTDHYSFFLSYITSVFYNIQRALYRMAMINYILMLSRHTTNWMSYGEST